MPLGVWLGLVCWFVSFGWFDFVCIEQHFWPDERASKELDIRNAECSPRLHGESLRKRFLMFMLRKAAEALFVRVLREMRPGLAKAKRVVAKAKR